MRRIIALPLALLAILTVCATVLAGGWATVAATGPTGGQIAGTETVVELEVLQHGATAVSWPRLNVMATNTATGETVNATATSTAGQIGRYTATLTLPTEGSWTLSYDSPDLVMEGTTTLAVSAPVVAPPVPARSQPSRPSSLAVGVAMLVLSWRRWPR